MKENVSAVTRLAQEAPESSKSKMFDKNGKNETLFLKIFKKQVVLLGPSVYVCLLFYKKCLLDTICPIVNQCIDFLGKRRT